MGLDSFQAKEFVFFTLHMLFFSKKLKKKKFLFAFCLGLYMQKNNKKLVSKNYKFAIIILKNQYIC